MSLNRVKSANMCGYARKMSRGIEYDMVICIVAGIIGVLQRVDKRFLRGVEYVGNCSDCIVGWSVH